jgi:enamine deaminase RidA (YjgF/YER057c/UK114 family)
MTQRRKVSSGSAYESAVGYSRAVRTGPHIVVAGTTAEGDSIAAQTREALRRIEIALQKVGASLSDVVRTRICVTDISLGEAVVAVPARCSARSDRRPPWLEVSALTSPPSCLG